MNRNQSRTPQILLFVFFFAFFAIVEYLLLSKLPLFSLAGQEYLMIAMISFLNLIPAGIFAFALISLLPRKYSSSVDDQTLLLQPPTSPPPKIAILYATYNDFMPNHAESDLNEARKGKIPFFILDDSKDPEKKTEVDSFAESNGCPVMRRSTREGYKAGAINEWLKRYGSSYDYFFILDSDSTANLAAITYCAELARRNSRLAIIQTKTLTMTSSPSRLTRSSVCIQHAYIAIVQKAMRKMGTSPYYGHNALVSVRAISSVGGFVEESNEDYKTLTLLHERGYESLYAEGATTWEEVPPDYMSARKRSLRWSRDAVSQLGLLRLGSPLGIIFFLFYGWVTHISNLALLLFLPLATAIALPHLFGNAFTEAAGVLAVSVVLLWPLLALRTKDPELATGKMGRALLWGSAYNIPMMAPLGLQILKTTVSKIYQRLTGLIGLTLELNQEFVVTPKIKNPNTGLLSILLSLKAEISLAVILILIDMIAGHAWSIIFAAPQVISSMSIPLLVYLEANRHDFSVRKSQPIPITKRNKLERQVLVNKKITVFSASGIIPYKTFIIEGPYLRDGEGIINRPPGIYCI